MNLRFIALMILLLALPDVSVLHAGDATARPAFQRWAVLSSPDIAASGLSDLLTAELSKKSIELVEREQLDAITREIELSKFFSADSSSQRLKVGQLVKADALVLLSLIENEQKKSVRLVVCDCRYGLRLRMELLPLEAEQADELAARIAQTIVETRTRFAGGVERIVAVSPFLSKNLTHEFDHLQFGFAALLGQGLSEQPGVAVLEVEEARAIGEELTRATTKLDRRSVPIIVESEFEIADETAPERPGSVRFVVRLQSEQPQLKTIEHSERTLTEASRWLIGLLPNQIANQQAVHGTRSLTPAEQCVALTQRADQFSRIAAYPQAAALREAVMLLEPDDWEQRVLLVADLCRRMHQMIFGGTADLVSDKLRTDPAYKRRCVEELHSLISGVEDHTERLLATKVLNLREAIHLIRYVTFETTMVINSDALAMARRPQFREFYWRCLTRAVRLDDRIRNGDSHPVFAALRGTGTTDESTLTQQHDQFAFQALNFLLASMPRCNDINGVPRFDDSETIRDIERLFLDVLRPDQFSAGVLNVLTRNEKGGMPFLVISKRISASDVIQLYERLRASGKPLLEFYARTGLLALKSSAAIVDPVTGADLEELDWLDTFLIHWQQQHRENPSIVVFGRRVVAELRKSLTQAAPKGTARKTSRPVELRLEGADPFPRLAFEPLDMTATWTALSSCGPGRDLVWSWESVGVLTAPGQLKTIVNVVQDPTRNLTIEQDAFASVAWDGEFIWVAGSRSGVRIFDLDGNQLGQLLPQSENSSATSNEPTALPPIERFTTSGARGKSISAAIRSLWLHPIDKGRCFVAGRFGKDYRRWFGVIERQTVKGDRPLWKFTLWHQLTKQNEAMAKGTDLETIFMPGFVADYVDPRDQCRWLLLGRTIPTQNTFLRTPLGIQVETGEVSFFPRPLNLPHSGPYHSQLLVIGENLVIAGQDEIVRMEHSGQDKALISHSLHQRESLARHSDEPRVIRDRDWTLRPELLPVNEWLYSPGANWLRINTRSWDVEQLTKAPVSLRYEFESYAVSAHYGLVAWNHGDPLYRVHVDHQFDEPRPLSWLYPFVPAGARERHHRAVEEIRRLGGQVDAVPGLVKSSGVNRTELWRTVVWLTDTWQGDDDGLRHLVDLHNVRDLFLERAPITDAGLQTISQLKTLNVLHVTETKATSAGVRSLAALPKLSHLWLENPAGRTLMGDDALPAFHGKLNLFQLTLGGHGFTDKSLSYVPEIPRLYRLRLIDTDTTPAAIATTKQKRKGLQLLSETNQ